MTKEQAETIKNIKIYIHDWISESVDEDGYERYAIGEEEKEFFNNIETVLNMLQEKDKEAQQYFETTVKQSEQFDKEIEKKDNDIHRMQELLDISDANNVKKDKIINEIKQLIGENLRRYTIFEKGYVYGFNECQYITRQIVELLRKNNILKGR